MHDSLAASTSSFLTGYEIEFEIERAVLVFHLKITAQKCYGKSSDQGQQFVLNV